MNQTIAAVFCAESYNALAVIRELGRRGVETLAIGAEADSISFRSRYATACLRHPDPLDEGAFVAFAAQLSRRLEAEGRRAVAFPSSDRVIRLLSEHREEIAGGLQLYLPSRATIANCLDKLAQYRLCEEIGVPYPRTYTNGSEAELRADLASGRLPLPLIFKARSPLAGEDLNRRFRRVLLTDGRQAEAQVQAAAEHDVPFVVQEYLPGGDDHLYTLGATMDREGALLAWFTGRKLRQMPPGIGICRVGETVVEPKLVEHGEKLLRALGFCGIAQVEFKFDARDGQFKLMEVNPRSWSWIGLPLALGCDLVGAMFSAARGAPPPPMPLEVDCGLWISLTHDFDFSIAHRDGLPWTPLFQGHDRIIEAYFAGDDPAPGLSHFAQFGQNLLRRIFRRWK
jgi:D-aspartate ligase